MLLWTGVGEWRADAAAVHRDETGWRATGVQLGVDPCAYRVDFRLEVSDALITERLSVGASGSGWSRELNLRHDGEGCWECTAQSVGNEGLSRAGGDMALLDGALDCDLGRCPLTNFMPVRRHGLHLHPGALDFLMAWVSVPDLAVTPSRQRYEHVGVRDGHRVVRYVGEHRGFVGELQFDDDGFVVHYPELARRVSS